MAVDIHGQAIQCTADTLIRTGPGLVYAINIEASGVGAGDTIVLRDAIAAGAGTALFTYVCAGNDTHDFCPCVPFACGTGIYLDVTLAGGGSVYVTVVYS